MEADSAVYKLLIGLAMGCGAFFIFLWAWLSGLFKDSEDIKHRIYRRELGEGAAGEEDDDR